MLKNIINKFSCELKLMLASANCDSFTAKYLLKQPINWEKFLRLAYHHRVYPPVYQMLSSLDNSLVPQNTLDSLRQLCQENTLSTLRITGETIRIGNLLEKQNICAIVLKGAPLSWRLYGDLALRPYDDIDILVNADNLEKSKALLENQGYHIITEYDLYNLTPRQQKIYLNYNKHSSHSTYLNKEKKVFIEIHWKMSKYGNVMPFPVEDNIKKIFVTGNSVTVLSDEEWVLYLALHGAGHKWHRMRWLFDIKKFMEEKYIDWASLNLKAEKYNLRLFLNQALILANNMFGVPIPPALESDITRDRAARRLAALALKTHILDAGYHDVSTGINSLYVNNSYGFLMNKGLKSKFNYLLKQFKPSVEDIKLVALPDRLYALYYFITPFTFIIRRLRRLIYENKI